MNNRPIGFFDSGIGGLSIWKAVNAMLPNESTIYLADSKKCSLWREAYRENQTL